MLNRIFDLFRLAGKHYYWTLAGILLLAAIPRGIVLRQVSEEQYYHNDGTEYMDIARNLAQGRGFSLSYYRWHEPEDPSFRRGVDVHTDLARTPLLPLLGALIHLLTENVTAGAKVFSFFLSLFAVYCVWLLGREIRGTVCGLWSSFLFSIYPYAIHYSACFSTEDLFLVSVCLAFVFFLKAIHGNYRMLGFCGLFLALGALTRPTAILLVPVFCLLLYFRFGVMGQEKVLPFHGWKCTWRMPRPLWKHTGIFLAVFFLCMMPWMVRNRLAGGAWKMTTWYDGYVYFLSFSEIFMVTYQTLDTKEYTRKTEEAWNRIHAHYIGELHRKKIYDFPSVCRQWRQWGHEQLKRHPERIGYLLKERFLHYWRMCPNLIVLTPLQIVLLRIFFSGVFLLALAGILLTCCDYDTWILLLPVFFGLMISIVFLFVLRYRYPFFAPYICVLSSLPLTEWRCFVKKAPKKSP